MYFRGTSDYGLQYAGNGLQECVRYSDADWAGDVNDYKSTSGYMFQIRSSAVSWRGRKQMSMVVSTLEAEYMALAAAAQETSWI